MTEDEQLMRQFKETCSEVAFASLVDRHIGLVYSIACRQVGGDVHLARDVCQVVFATLARKAVKLGPDVVLTGWLYRCTLFEAKSLMRAESRRRIREMEALLMDDAEVDEGQTVDWEAVRPILDEVMGELNESDRGVICLRFFENLGYAEIGERLGIKENASRMRVSRALDKLNGKLARRGVRSASAAVGVAIAGQAAISAPVGLSAAVTQGALGAMATVGGGSLLGTAIGFMNTTKVTLGGASLFSLLAVGTIIYQARQLSAAEETLAGLRERRAELALWDERIREVETAIAARDVELAALRKSLSASVPSAAPSHGFEVEDFEAALEQWATRADNLAEFLSRNPGYRIAEIDLLEASDWLEVTKSVALQNEAEYRKALLGLRLKAKHAVSRKIGETLKAFREATGRTMPSEIEELFEYAVDPIVKETLRRYEILPATEAFPSWPVGDEETAFFEQEVPDPIWFARYNFNARGGMYYKGSEAESALQRISEVISRFETGNGRTPENAAELEPLLSEEIDLELLPEIFEAIRTPVQFEQTREADE